MNEKQIQKQVEQLVKLAMSGDKQAVQQIEQIMQAAQIAPYIQNAIKSAQATQNASGSTNTVNYSKNGSKLNYIKQLKGSCPEGYEVEYFANGGGLAKRCRPCEEKQKMEEGAKTPVDAFKCGRKMKKVKKAQDGKTIETPKMKQEYYDVDGRNIIRTINKEIPDTSIVVREPIKERKNSYINYIMTKDDNNIPQTNYPPYNDMQKELWWKLINGYLDNKK